MSRDFGDTSDQAGTDAIERFIETGDPIETVDGTVVAVVAVDADDDVVASVVTDRGFDDVVTSRDPVAGGARVGLSCRGDARRIRELVARLDSTDGVADVTVTVLQVRA